MKGKLTKQRTTAGHEFRARNRMWDNVLTCVHCGQAYGSEDTVCSMNPEVADLYEKHRWPGGREDEESWHKLDELADVEALDKSNFVRLGGPTVAHSGHQWNDDRCELCGDKDWRADRFCSGNPSVRLFREQWLERQRQQAHSPAGEKESNKKG